MIPVTKPFLPPIEKYQEKVNGIWQRAWLTNNGPLVNDLELSLKKYLNLKHLLYTNNGTIAIQIAIKALDLKGEIITTPFSYVATTSSIVWEGCTPVFVDVDPESLNINPRLIEAAITDKTSAILATHVYGNPCDVDAIAQIAKKYNLKVIYDGAHAFGTKVQGNSLFEYGDITTTSFHATKLFHTIEGGAVFSNDPETIARMAFHRNFGHDGPEKFAMVGINGKNSEFHAAMGLVNLEYIDSILEQRKKMSHLYDSLLFPQLNAYRPKIYDQTDYNCSYYPIVFNDEAQFHKTLTELNIANIFPRRYFYPSLDRIPYVKEDPSLVHSHSISERVMCLPLFYTLSEEEVQLIARLILRIQNYG
jgi:dTDP-4-amino-4,6-dideoxygalactose transaminase